jgi:hypothetical protein
MKVDYFGGCPTCGRNDVYLNSDLPWIFGANPFSSWRDETEAEERARVAPLWSGDPHHFVFVFNSRAIIDDATPRTVEQMADDLKDIAAEVALAGVGTIILRYRAARSASAGSPIGSCVK